MKVKEIIESLSCCNGDFDVHVETPDGSDDFFVDGVRYEGEKHQVFIETSQ